MKKIAHVLLMNALLFMLVPVNAGAAEMNPESWQKFCTQDKDKQTCAKAEMICEQNEKVDCDSVKQAVMSRRSLRSVIPNDSAD